MPTDLISCSISVFFVVPTAIQAWQTCSVWEPIPRHPHFLAVDLATRGFVYLFFLCVFRNTVLGFSVFYVFSVVSTSATDCLERLVSEMTYYVSIAVLCE